MFVLKMVRIRPNQIGLLTNSQYLELLHKYENNGLIIQESYISDLTPVDIHIINSNS